MCTRHTATHPDAQNALAPLSPCNPGTTAGVEDASSVKLIAGGKTLQDDGKPVSGYNVGPTTRVLVTKGAAAQHAVSGQEAAQRNEEARLAQLERLKATVEKLSRGDGRGLTDDYEFSLENQVSSQAVLRGACSAAWRSRRLGAVAGRLQTAAWRTAEPGTVRRA